MEKEKILVSACLLGINCKYDGGNNKNEKVLEYLKDKEVIPICPEILGGLATPRMGAERVEDKVLRKDGVDVTEEYKKGASETLYIAKLLGAKKALLKAKSPSCGSNIIYDGTFTKTKIKGDGVASELLKNNSIEIITEEDL